MFSYKKPTSLYLKYCLRFFVFLFHILVVLDTNGCLYSDGSDEENCENKQCEPWMFACGDGRCIYNTWKCGNNHSLSQI